MESQDTQKNIKDNQGIVQMGRTLHPNSLIQMTSPTSPKSRAKRQRNGTISPMNKQAGITSQMTAASNIYDGAKYLEEHPNAYLCQEEDKTYQLLGKDIKLSNGKRIEVGANLDFVKQVQADTQIKDTTITPFDKDRYCQVLMNPRTRMSDKSYEIITVQHIQENIRHYDSFETLERHTFLASKDPGRQFEVDPTDSKHRLCEYCGADKPGKEFYHCTVSTQFDICMTCMNKSFIRRKIEEKTSRHRFYQDYFLRATDEKIKGTKIKDMATSIKANDMQLDALEQNTRVACPLAGVLSHQFANVAMYSDKEWTNTNGSMFPEHAIIGFWCQDEKGRFRCYRQFRVDQPLYLQRVKSETNIDTLDCRYHIQSQRLSLIINHDYIHVETLLHVGEQGQIYYFYFQEDLEVCYLEIDLDRAMDKDLDSNKEFDEDYLELLNRKCYRLPSKQTVQFEGVTQQFMQEMFSVRDKKKLVTNTPPQLYATQESSILAFVSPYDICMSTSSNRDPEYQLSKKDKKPSSSLLFIDLQKPEKFAKIIFDAKLLIRMYHTTNFLPAISGGDIDQFQGFQLWYATVDSIVNVKWEDVKDPHLIQFNVPKGPGKTICTYKIVPKSQEVVEAAGGNNSQENSKQQAKASQQLMSKIRTYWKGSNEIQSRVNRDSTRITILFGGRDYYVFQLIPSQEAGNKVGQAQVVLDHPAADDVCFAMVEHDPDASFVVCNMQKQELNLKEHHREAQNVFTLDVFDLDQANPAEDQDAQENQGQLEMRQIKLALSHGFKKYKSDAGYKLAPYQFMTFYLYQTDEQKANDEGFSCVNQLFFIDQNIQQQRLAFTFGREIDFKNDEDFQFKRSQHMPYFQSTFKWPIMAHNNYLPMQNQLIITNLTQNVPQKRLDLGNYRFLSFVNTGAHIPFTDSSLMQTLIFFLVVTPNNDAIRLMYYSEFAWPIAEGNTKIPIKRSTLKIVDGIVCKEGNPLFKSFFVQKILAANLLHHKIPDRGEQVSIVVQFNNNIAVCNLNSPDDYKYLCNKRTDRMAGVFMIQAPNNQLYYVKRMRRGDALMGVVQKGGEVYEYKILELPKKILHTQLANTVQSDEFNHMLYLLTHDGHFLEVICKSSPDDFDIEDQKFDIVRDIPLEGIDSLLLRLQQRSFQQMIVSPRMITCHKESITQNLKPWQHLGLITYNLESLVSIEHDFLGYASDDKEKLFLKDDPSVKDYSLVKNCYVHYIKQIPCVNKILTVVCEKNYTYIKVQNAFDDRQIKLIDQDHSSNLVQQMNFVGDKIAVQLPGQTLFFSQYDYMLKRVEPFTIQKKFNNHYTAETEGEYFIIKSQYEQNNKTVTFTPVVKLDNEEERLEIVRENSNYLNFVKAKEDFKEIASGINCILSKVQPSPIMSNMGTFVQVYYTYPKKQDLMSEALIFQLNGRKQKQETAVSKSDKTYIYKIKQHAFINKKWYQNSHSQLKMLQYCEVLGPEEQDFIYIVRHDDWDTEGWARAQVCQTKDYLVIKHQTSIYFVSLEEIDFVNYKASKSIKQNPLIRTSDEEIQKYDFLNQKMADDHCQIKMTSFDMSNILNDRMHENDFKVIPLSHKQVLISDKNERRDNLVQLMFNEISIVWDLNENKEVVEFMAPDQFSTPDTFQQLGININVIDKNFNQMKDVLTIEENRESSLFIKPKLDDSNSAQLFRTYSMLSLWDIDSQLQQLQSGNQPNQVDLEAVLVNIYGQTYFEIMRKHPEFFNQVKDQLLAKELEKFQGDNRVEYDNIYMRRLKATLMTPIQFDSRLMSMSEKVLSKEIKSLSNILVHHHQKRAPIRTFTQKLTLLQHTLRDCDENTRLLLESQLGFYLLSSEIHMQDLICNFDDFKLTFQYSSKQITNFLEASFRSTEMTEDTRSVKWKSNAKQIVFGAETAHLSSEAILDRIEENFVHKATSNSIQGRCRRLAEKLSTDDGQIIFTGVNVNIVQVSWLCDKMDEFYYFMSGVKDLNIFDTQLVKVVLNAQKYSNQLTYKLFLPWLTYFVVNVYYMSTVAVDYDSLQEKVYFKNGWQMRIYMAVCIIAFMSLEFSQMYRGGFEYFKDVWNWNYLLIYLLNAFILVEHEFPFMGVSEGRSTVMASIQVMQLWIGLLYWLRLFTTFSRYIHLILATLSDVKAFMVLFFIVLFAFSNGLYIVDKDTPSYDVDWETEYPALPNMQPCKGSKGKVIDGAFDQRIVDSVVNQYLLSIGEFAIDAFDGAPDQSLIWIMFICATYMSNIVFLNMIVAIMGDTFGQVAEDWERSALVERTRIYADYMPSIQLSQKFKNQKFIYVVSPQNDEETSELTEAIKQVDNEMKKNNARITQEYKSSFDNVRAYQAELQLTMNKHQVEVQEMKATIGSEIQDIKSTLDTLLKMKLNQRSDY